MLKMLLGLRAIIKEEEEEENSYRQIQGGYFFTMVSPFL
jgi:hypothetical protein